MLDAAVGRSTGGDAEQDGKPAAGAVVHAALPFVAAAVLQSLAEPIAEIRSIFVPNEHRERFAVQESWLSVENVRGGAIGPPNNAVLVGDDVAVGRQVEQLPVE